MTNKESVQNLERELIGKIKTLYDNLKLEEDDVIEFRSQFIIMITEYDREDIPFKVSVTISGMMDNYILAGVSSEGSEVEISVDNLESLYELAHLADLIEEGSFITKVF